MTVTSVLPDVRTPSDLFSLAGRVALVTGASSGLGARFARCLDAAGASVVVTARRRERLEDLAGSLRDAVAVPVDIVEETGPEQVIGAAIEAYGRIDVLVNNAGVSTVEPALSLDRRRFREELEIDLVVPYQLARLAAKEMIAGSGGSVINIGSILGTVAGGRLRVPGYAAAKGGLHHLTRELASQWARGGVRVNAIAPAWFETEMNDGMFADPSGRSYIRDNTPMGRAGRDGELDGALIYLASDASSFVTGQVLHVDGGWTSI